MQKKSLAVCLWSIEEKIEMIPKNTSEGHKLQVVTFRGIMEACETKLSFKGNCFILLTLYGNFYCRLCTANKKY